MRLSEAIRLGAMLRPQEYGASDHGGGSCALRAAGEAVGIGNHARVVTQPLDYVALEERWPVLKQGVYECPARCRVCQADNVMENIWYLNDVHKWTREQIADWVATVEPAETTSAANEPVDVRGTESLSQPVLATREA